MPEHEQTQQSKKPKSSSQIQNVPASQIPVSHPASIIQRARINPQSLTHADVMQLQRTIGNRAVGRLLSEIGLIRSTAKKVPVQRQEIPEEEKTLQGKITEPIQRQEIPEEEEPLQTKRENNTGLPDNLKAGVESLSGIDMSDVRVHYSSSKPAEVGALAYTQGTDIHVAPGQEKHLSHESWHVVQQAQGRVKPTMQLKDGVPVNDDEGLEHEADVMGAKALQMRRADQVTFGADFGRVRLHADGVADSLNRSIQAQAFTTGQDVFLRQGEYQPGSFEGQRLLAHELTHVVQQRDGRVRSAAELAGLSVSNDPTIDINSRIVGYGHRFQSTRIIQRNSIVPQVIQLTRAGEDVNTNVPDPKTHNTVFDRFMIFLHTNNFQYKESGEEANVLEDGPKSANCGRLAMALNTLFTEVGLAGKDPVHVREGMYVDIDDDFAQQDSLGNCVDIDGNIVRAFYFSQHSYLNGYDPTLGKRGADINFQIRTGTSSANNFIRTHATANGYVIGDGIHDLVNAHQFPGFYILTRGPEKSVKVMNDQMTNYLRDRGLIRERKTCTIM